MPLTLISKRLHIKYCRVQRIIKNDITDANLAFCPYSKRPKYKKLHKRARDDIDNLLLTSTHPVSIRDI